MNNLKMRFLYPAVGSAMYARFIVSHYHTFFRINGGDEHKVVLPDCDLDGEFVADPFLFVWDGRVWLFFEGMRKGRGNRGVSKGLIGCMCYSKGAWNYQGIAIEESFHLSYPQVFEDNGVVYMIPETAQTGEISLYEAIDFPKKWKKKAVIIKGKYVDSSLFRKNGMYYIVTTPDDRTSHAELWCATSLTGMWERHPASNGVLSSLSFRRNGGMIYEDAGHIYRIAQDCDGGYGRRLYRVSVMELSTSSYSEGSPVLLQDAISWVQPEMHHTYNRVRQGDMFFEVVDRHYNTFRKLMPFMISAFWCFMDGIRYIMRMVVRQFDKKQRSF